MKKTIGPVRDSFLVYNSQGLSKGMAVVSFVRQSDAVRAKNKYDQKMIDNREHLRDVLWLFLPNFVGRPLKIEFIVDSDTLAQPDPPKAREKTLFERIGMPAAKAKTVPAAPPTAPRIFPVGRRVTFIFEWLHAYFL